MRVCIDAIDAFLSMQNSETGYWIGFRSELVSGKALLAATHRVGPALRGREIFVEVDQRSVCDVRVLKPDEPQLYSLVPLAEEGSFDAVGTVDSVLPEAGDLISVRVGDDLFHWTPDEAGCEIFLPGTWLRFTIVGLVLWDTDI